MVYTVTLNPALDYVMLLDTLDDKDINRAKQTAIFGGGKGINVSSVLAQLDVRSTALGFVGGFSGEELERLAKAEGMNCDFTHIQGGNTRINVKVKAQCEFDINAEGPAVSDREVLDLLGRIDRLQDGDVLILSGSVPKGLPQDIYEQMMCRISDRNVLFVVDTTGEGLKNALPYHPFLVKPNHHELGELFGVTLHSQNEVIAYAKRLQEMGARNVLVSCAQDGAVLVDESGTVSTVGIAEGKLVNSCGCGDSMVAGFVAGYLQRRDYTYALRLGAACGSATAFSVGLARRREIDEIFKQL